VLKADATTSAALRAYDTVRRELAYLPSGLRPTIPHVSVHLDRCNGSGRVWRKFAGLHVCAATSVGMSVNEAGSAVAMLGTALLGV
jgi:hypothetical protein